MRNATARLLSTKICCSFEILSADFWKSSKSQSLGWWLHWRSFLNSGLKLSINRDWKKLILVTSERTRVDYLPVVDSFYQCKPFFSSYNCVIMHIGKKFHSKKKSLHWAPSHWLISFKIRGIFIICLRMGEKIMCKQFMSKQFLLIKIQWIFHTSMKATMGVLILKVLQIKNPMDFWLK